MCVGRTGHKVLKPKQRTDCVGPSACRLYSAALGMCPSVYVLRNRSLRRADVNTLSVSLHPVFIWCEYLWFVNFAVCRYHAGSVLRYWVSLNTPFQQCYQLFMQCLAPAEGCLLLNKDNYIGNIGRVSVLCLHQKKSFMSEHPVIEALQTTTKNPPQTRHVQLKCFVPNSTPNFFSNIFFGTIQTGKGHSAGETHRCHSMCWKIIWELDFHNSMPIIYTL